MSSNRRSGRNVIGPQSALTDFLATHNISAQQIRDDFEQRRAAANASSDQAQDPAADADTDAAADTTGEAADDATEAGPSTSPLSLRPSETKAEKRKREAKEKKAIEKIKASKSFKRRTRHAGSDDDLDEMARALFEERSAPAPGQIANCDICEKRFTVTPYSRPGPSGGLLCSTCSKEVEKDDERPKKKKPRKSTNGVGGRRKVQSSMMDGTYHRGAKNLMRLCIETLAQNVHLADSLGELPTHVEDKIARLFSKRRLLKPATLPLFMRPSTETLSIYTAAYLSSDDLMSVFMTCSKLKELKVRDAIQFKDEVMDYIMTRNTQLEKLSIHGANLITSESWTKFITNKGGELRTLQVYATDKGFNDEVVALLSDSCPQLTRLKIDGNQELSSDGVKNIGLNTNLKHLSLRLQQKITPKTLVHLVRELGPNLETLSLRQVPEANDELLTMIKSKCTTLKKLRIRDSEFMTDEGFVDLFTEWGNLPLQIVDLESCRHMDATKPRDNSEKVGLCGEGFKALMVHSMKNIRSLNVSSCRHITKEAFEAAFAKDTVYKELTDIDVSLCEEVDDYVVGCIFRSCPALRKLIVWGCMKVTSEHNVPRGVLLIGVPNAMGVEIAG
ncbi:DNA repair protein Rad7 [Plectosphaerella plurivora]|uniref:DNA repair protein Rad7 n=1 Tax=Plectosphaerella plurivora TaxID=936078 RepID=A0A9P8VE14_9PEZI|nr:DNA repair protein Rad7 [Plectosphaerella plurivora]